MSLNRQHGGLLAGLAALTALFVAIQPKPAESGKSRGESQKTDNSGSRLSSLDSRLSDGPAPEGPIKPIWDFLGLSPSKDNVPTKRYAIKPSLTGELVIEEPSKQEPGTRFYDWPTCCELEGCEFRFLIATVPDPLDSGLAFTFDQVMEALQRAMEAGGYVLDRAWLPWRREGANTPADLPLHKRHPGLVLFRDDRPPAKEVGKPCPSPQRLLALLLVGETPTAGIHKIAFRNAVRLIHSCPGQTVEGNRIRVLGPHYSGSAVSLGLALKETRQCMQAMPIERQPQEPWIKVVCGSASGFSHDTFVQSFAKDGKPDNEKKQEERAFATTILPNDVLLHWVRKYLGNPANPITGESPPAMVILHEANTSFGQYVIGERAKEANPKMVFLIPFPLHISQLRASYTKEQLARAESQGLPHVSRDLPLPSDDDSKREGEREVIAVRDPLMTAVIDDLILNNLVTTMAQKRASHACLVSTDSRDTIFLARLIRDHYPDVQLVALGGDLLFTHDDYNYPLRGMIVASTYPLYPSMQGWSDIGPDHRHARRILFAQESYQGCYNAALVHLTGLHALAPKDLESLMMDYGWEGKNGDGTLPPLWISIVGSNGQMIPVTYIAPNDYARNLPKGANLEYLYHRPRGSDAPSQVNYGRLPLPSTWFLAFAVLLTVSVWWLYRAFSYLRDSRWGISLGDRSARYKQRIDFAVGCLALVLLYGMIAELACTPLRAGLSQDRWTTAVGTWLLLAASILMAASAWFLLALAYRQEFMGLALKRRRAAYRKMVRDSQPLHPWLVGLGWPFQSGAWIVFADVVMFVAVSLLVVCFAWRILVSAIGPFGPQNVVYFERVVSLTNGVSSFLPRMLFCAALFGWSYFLVKKLHLANHYSVACPFPCNGWASFTGLRGLHQDVQSELMPPSTLQKHFGWCVLMFVLVLIAFFNLASYATWPVDGRGFGLWALFGFATGSFLLLFTLLQFHFAWRSLRKLLRFVALLPMQNAFERLSDKVVGTFGHYLHSLRPRHSHLAISVQQFHRVRRLFPAFRSRLQKVVKGSLHLEPLDSATRDVVWQEVRRTFPEPELEPAIAQQFDRELNPVLEMDLEPPAGSKALEWGGVAGKDIQQLSQHCLQVLYPLWSLHPMAEAFGKTTPSGEATEKPGTARGFLSLPEGDPIREWIVAAEDFVAIEIIRYLSQFIVQLRNLLTCLTLGSLLLVLAATVYPFFPQHKLLLFLSFLAGSIAVVILTFLVQLNREELISRITRSTPNRFTPDLSFLHGTTAYVLPILLGVMVQFPVVTSTLRSLLDPLFHILK